MSSPRPGWKAGASVRAGENVEDSMPRPATGITGRDEGTVAPDALLSAGESWLVAPTRRSRTWTRLRAPLTASGDRLHRLRQRPLQRELARSRQPGIGAQRRPLDHQVLGHQRMA